MKVSLKWLSEYVDVPADTKAFCDRLDLTGTGVEAVEKTGEAYDGVVVGYVETCEQHPDSDHMHVVSVNVGADEPTQIVCGAPNIAAGIKVPVACVGAVLPGDFKIKKSKLRGVTSCGMCCSQRELGMGSNHEGIWILPEDAVVGTPRPSATTGWNRPHVEKHRAEHPKVIMMPVRTTSMWRTLIFSFLAAVLNLSS